VISGLLLLASCGTFGLSDAASADDTAAGLSLDALDPDWGRYDEATAVTLTGSGLTAVESVWFGNAEVTDITHLDDATIVATAPSPGFETVVDVKVVAPSGTDTLVGGFTYAEHEPEGDADTDTDADTDSDTDADTDTSGAGKTGGLIQFSLTQYTCPQCYDPPLSSDLLVSAQAAFHDPTRDGWLDWLPAEGSCATDASPDSPASSFLDAGNYLYLNAGSRSIGLLGDTTNIYTADGLDETDFVRNSGYDLSAAGGRDLDGFDVTDAITTPQAISALTPTGILLTSDRDLFTAQISKRNAAFTWSPVGDGTFLVILTIFNGSSGAYLGEVTCRGPDNGRMTVPSSALNSYPNGSLLTVGLYRYSIGSFERPDNASSVDTVASFGVVGTGSLSQ
jgi:hypothetical protein